VELGYAFSSEEHGPLDLVRHARAAEEAGFSFGLISDHYHPWIPRQGHSPFVWSVIGGIAQATERFRLGTGVTCPLIRTHPAVIAQAAATSAAMMPGRFFLGVGTGENLNEHILGDRWPSADERVEMLEEAIEVIRLLWQGGTQTHRGRYYTVDHARVYTLPEEPPPIYVAAGAQRVAGLAGRLGDGLIAVSPDEEVVRTFEENGGGGKPKVGMVHVCFAETEEEGRRTAFEMWPTSGLKGPLNQELPLPEHFAAAAEGVTEEDVAEAVPHGPDPGPVLEEIRAYADAGFTHAYVHQIGPDQQGFLDFARRELLPQV
jgi:coenzyme F420-dependent glucose-6-phosphate dehydrogenase